MMDFKRVLATLMMGFLGIGPAHAQSVALSPDPIWATKFWGHCDGSAVVRIDDQTLVSANDETNILTAYNIWGGRRVAERSLNGLLGFGNDATAHEMDIEAVVPAKDRIWWIGSHGLDKKANLKPNRRTLFATNHLQRDLSNVSIVGKPIDLLPVLKSSPLTSALFTQEVMARAPKKGGVSIEGMTLDDAGHLVIGFRSPLSGATGETGNALIVTVQVVADVASVGSIKQIDLGDQGVRDITRVDGGYLIVAGDVDEGKESRLMFWDGADSVQQVDLALGPKANPEAIVQINNGFLILHDDGNMKRADDTADDGNRRCKKILKNSPKANDHENAYFRGAMYLEK